MTYNVFSETLNPTQSVNQTFTLLTLSPTVTLTFEIVDIQNSGPIQYFSARSGQWFFCVSV